MSTTPPSRYHDKLCNFMHRRGYASFVVGSNPTNIPYACDVISFKAGNAFIFKAVWLQSGSSMKKISDDAEELRLISTNAKSMGMTKDKCVTVGFAVYKDYESRWYFTDDAKYKIKASDPMRELDEVVNL